MTTRLGFIVVLSVLGCHLSSLGANLTWTGTASSDFYNATNWAPQATPGSGDTLNITNGLVTILPAFTSSGQVNWTGGAIGGGLIISNTGLLAMSSTNIKSLSASITNSGTITLTGTLLFNTNNLQIVNQSLFDIQGDGSISSGGFTGLQITNSGTFRKSGGTNACTINVPIQNTGSLSALTGTVDLQGGGILGGSWNASNKASLTFTFGTFTLLPNALSSGAGFIGVAGGFPSFAGTLSATMGWKGGTVGGYLNIATNGVLTISGTGATYLAAMITNSGTMTLTNSAQLQFNGYNLHILNQPGALIDLQGDASITSDGFTVLLISNAGTFRKSAGTNVSPVNVPFQNTGTLSALSGDLDLEGGGTLAGNLTVSGGASLTFSTGNFALSPSAVSGGPGFIGVAGGSPAFSGTLATSMSWTGGAVAGNWSVGPAGALAMSGSGQKFLSGNITNGGTITLTGSLFFNANNLQIINQSLFDIQSDATISSAGYTGLQIANSGTFRKSAGVNSCTITAVPFRNTGTLSALSGNLSFTSAFTNAGGALAVQLNSATSWGRFTFSGGLVLNGMLQATMANGFAPTQGSQFQLISSGTLGGTFASLNVPEGDSVNYTNNAVVLVVSVVPAQLINITDAGGNFGFSFATVNGQSYTIQRNDDLGTTNWIFYTNFTGNGSVMQFLTPLTNMPSRFFRVSEP